MILLSTLAAFGGVIIVVTLLMTGAVYNKLPDRVPLHLGPDGTPNGYGPRPMIWLLPAVQITTATMFYFVAIAIANGTPGISGTVRGTLLSSVALLAILWRAQRLLLDVAIAGGKVPMRGFIVFFVAALAAVVLSAVLL